MSSNGKIGGFGAEIQNFLNFLTGSQTPSTNKNTPAQTAQKEDYIVKRGDTMTEIAVKTGQNLQDLIRKNPQIKNPNKIYVGQHIKTGDGQTQIYTVKRGDTLSDIAKKYKTGIGDILRANPGQIANRNLIYPGQKLNIPSAERQKQPQTAKPMQKKTSPTAKPQTPVENKPTAPHKTNPPVGTTPKQTVQSGNLEIKQIDLDEFLSPEKGSRAGYAILIGNAEGNRLPNGGFVRPNYYGHRDPGDHKWNIGSFSYSNERGGQKANSPEDADRIQLRKLSKEKDVYVAAMKKAGLDPNNSLLATVYLDSFNQSEKAARLLLKPQNLEYIKKNGITIETMREWRFRGFVNKETGQRWRYESGGLAGGSGKIGLAGVARQRYGRPVTEEEIQKVIRQDQTRRVNALVKPMKSVGLLTVKNQTNANKGLGEKRPLPETPANKTASNEKELSRAEINIPYVKLKPGNDIRLSPQVAVRLGKIANEYHQATGKNLTVTDGNRSSLEQGFMMIRQIRKHKLGIYRARNAALEVKKVYDAGMARGKSDNQIAQDIAVVIKGQIARGVYISPHLRNNAADIRFSDMGVGDRARFTQIVNKYGGEVVTENDHFHIQWK